MNGMTETMFPASSQHHSTRHKYHLSTIPLGRLKKFEIIYTFNSVVVPCDFGAKFYFTSPIFILHLFFLRLNMNLFFKTTRDDLNVHAMIRTNIVPHQRIVSQTSSHLDLEGVSWICLLLFALLWNRCGIKSLVRTIALQQVHGSTMMELFGRLQCLHSFIELLVLISSLHNYFRPGMHWRSPPKFPARTGSNPRFCP